MVDVCDVPQGLITCNGLRIKLHLRGSSHAKTFPVEFRSDVVAVARKHKAPLAQIAKDFGISEATLHN